MPYGMPCPDDMNPMDVFTSVEQCDQCLSQFVNEVTSILAKQVAEMSGAINYSLDTLTKWIQRQLSTINGTLGDVYNVLNTSVLSQQFVTSSQVQTTINDIANTLNVTNEEIMYGPYPPGSQVPPGLPFPQPPPGSLPTPPSPYFPPGTYPGYPPGYYPQPPGVPGNPPGPPSTPPGSQPGSLPTPSQPVSVVVGGVTVNANPICAPVLSPQVVNVGGNTYTPTINVVNTGGGMSTGPEGQATVGISYDVQPDGSIAVHVGHVTLLVSLPHSDPNSSNPACPLVPVE